VNETEPPGGRPGELAAALRGLRERIERACATAGRSASDLTVIAVTKTYPVSDIVVLQRLGLRDIGENRVEEIAAKRAEIGVGVRWHFVGRIQSRQARTVAETSDVVHSVDRDQIAGRLGRFAVAAGRSLSVFVQLSLDGDPRRGGVIAAEIPALADIVATTPGLSLAGVMAVPPLGADPATSYAEAAAVRDRIAGNHPDATGLSAGMSSDLEPAISAGATHLRVGTALLGRRARVVG